MKDLSSISREEVLFLVKKYKITEEELFTIPNKVTGCCGNCNGHKIPVNKPHENAITIEE